MMQHSKVLLFILFLFTCEIALAQAENKLSLITVRGNQFITEDGKPIIFRGLNTSDPDKLERGGNWEKEYFEEMKRWGANIVRFPVHPTAWRARGQEEYLKLLDKGVSWAGALGMYVIIDWHSIGNLKNEMFQSPMYETTLKETYEFWRTISHHYTGNNTVAFFEIFNEPTVMNGRLGTCTWDEWKSIIEEAIVIIRANGSSAIPLIAGFNWAYDLKEVAEKPIEAEGIAYVSHPYPQKREKPWEDKWTEDWGFVAEKHPLILTEIGFSLPEEKGAHTPVISDESYGEAIVNYTHERGISFVIWVFDPQWAPRLFKDWDYTPTRHGLFFRKVLQNYEGD